MVEMVIGMKKPCLILPERQYRLCLPSGVKAFLSVRALLCVSDVGPGTFN